MRRKPFDKRFYARVNSRFSLREVKIMESKYAKENVSTKQSQTRQKARVSSTHGDKERPRRIETTPRQRPQAADGSSLLSFALPKEARLAKRAEFLRVYEQGTRFEGRLMTMFAMPNNRPLNRIGVTATKKAIGKAHDRNRAKRLMRECFRLSRRELDALTQRYDIVLNARRSVVFAKLEKPLAEFRMLIGKLAAN